MATIVSDTHKAILLLQKSKLSSEQAQGIVEFVERHLDLSHLATKDDVKDLMIKLYDTKLDLYKALAGQTIIILGVVIAMLQFLK